ncbi:MAG: endonuclease/exonuclease/phosphatase family protein [Phycisphaerae bacterium]|nr:endonuclease/exonuclease/phosphatase family protein [Phycisphaerae bacterium]
MTSRMTRRRTVRLMIAALAVLAAGCGDLAGPQRGRQGAASVQLRVVTYNILHGAGPDKKLDLGRTAEVIRRLSPDLVALQEVDKGTRRSGGVDEAAELGGLTGMHAAFGKAMDFDGGQYGDAVLSRFPIERTVGHALPHSKDREPRQALEVHVSVPVDGPPSGKPGGGRRAESWSVRFISTHWDHLNDDVDRVLQAKAVAELAATEPVVPVILAGDLNAEPGSVPLAALGAGWLDTTPAAPEPSFPSDRPTIRIDFIFARPANHWRGVSAEVVHEPWASDHRPVLAVLELLPAPQGRPQSE